MEQTKEKSISVTLNHLSALQPAEIAGDERVKTMFVRNYNMIHKSNNGEQIYELEKYYFSRTVSASKDLKECTKLSLYACFLEVAANNRYASFDPNKKLSYIMPENVNIGTRDNPQWEKRAVVKITPSGELAMRQDYGQISSADNPVFVYANEDFKLTITDAGKKVTHSFSFPRKGEVVACYLRIIKTDGAIDYSVLDLEGMMRLKEYSSRKNNGKPNALYSSRNGQPDLGFWEAKVIKHAFDSYPKIKIKGQFTKLQSESEDDGEVDYGLNMKSTPEIKPEAITPHTEVDQETGEVFEPTYIAEAPVSKEEDLDI